MASRFCVIARRSTEVKKPVPSLAVSTPGGLQLPKRQTARVRAKYDAMSSCTHHFGVDHCSQSSTSMGSESIHSRTYPLAISGASEISKAGAMCPDFDTIGIRDCVQALRDLKHLSSSRRSSTLRIHLIQRIHYSILADPTVDDAVYIDLLDALLDNFDAASPLVTEACSNILFRSSSWKQHPRVFWKLKGKRELAPIVRKRLSDDSVGLDDLLFRHSSCLLFKCRLLDLMLSVNALMCDVARIVASITETLQLVQRESLQLKPLYSSLVEATKDRLNPLWNLPESRELVNCILSNRYVPSKPGPTTVALATAILLTGGIRSHRSPLVYQILADSFSQYDESNACNLLEICCQYKLPSEFDSGFSSRKKASLAASMFMKKFVSQIESSNPSNIHLESLSLLASLLAHPTIEIKSSICLWNFIHEKFVTEFPNPIDCIRVLVSAEKAGDRCGMKDTIERSLMPLAILGLRQYLEEGRDICRIVNEISSPGKVSSRIAQELVEHIVGRIRGDDKVPVEDVVKVLTVVTNVDSERIEILEKYIVSKILTNQKRIFPQTFWIDVLRVTQNASLAEFSLTKLDWVSLSLADLISVSRWVDMDNVEWKDSAKKFVLPEDREKTEVGDLLNALRRKHARIEQYSEFPDGLRDGNIAAAFCGIILSFSLGLSAERVFLK